MIKLRGNQKSYADIDPVHSNIGCVNCHGGTEPAGYADGFNEAHDSTTFIKDPSRNPELYCGPCHAQIVATNQYSMHTMAWGEMTTIAQRELGAGSNHTDFDACPEALTNGFDSECSSCHTTCGQCHISRPNSVHGGFINSHQFRRVPDQTNNCMACHGSRIATDYQGNLSGNQPDVHYIKGKKCFDCHQEDFHADASYADTRYHLNDLPTCADNSCHPDENNPPVQLSERNQYHIQHWPDDQGDGLSCYVCHSQPYYNCNNCHTGGEWKDGYTTVGGDVHVGGGDYREYPDFKIGYNYNQDLFDGKWIVVRHIPVSPDSYEPWGHANLANFDDRPNWEYSSPHNIRLFTAQTDTSGGAYCSDNCHMHEVRYDNDGNMSNFNPSVVPGIYLLPDSVTAVEAAANEPVTVIKERANCSPCHGE